MTDLLRHSKGYWRSLFIFAEIEEQHYIKEEVMEALDNLNFEYSYCHYGGIKSPDLKLEEKAHITFRINFPDLNSLEDFKAWLKTKKWKWEDHNYDEALWVKKAYVLGTKLFKEARKASKSPDVPLDFNFLRLMFHGFFNDLGYSRKREIKFYYFLFDSMLKYLYGLGPEELDLPT